MELGGLPLDRHDIGSDWPVLAAAVAALAAVHALVIPRHQATAAAVDAPTSPKTCGVKFPNVSSAAKTRAAGSTPREVSGRNAAAAAGPHSTASIRAGCNQHPAALAGRGTGPAGIPLTNSRVAPSWSLSLPVVSGVPVGGTAAANCRRGTAQAAARSADTNLCSSAAPADAAWLERGRRTMRGSCGRGESGRSR